MVYARKWIQGGWLDACAQSIRRMDFVLKHLEIKELIVKNDLYKQNQGTDRSINQPKSCIIARQTQQTTA